MDAKQNTKDLSISAIRLISTLFIVSCHFMQYFDCELAWWFNVGVQIFLCISGYLYGSKNITDMPAFYCKSFRKILVGYFSVIIPVLFVHYFFVKDIGIKQVIFCLVANQTVSGGGHLWFIPLILLCYVITPFLNQYFGSDSPFKLVAKLFFILLVTEVTFRVFIDYYNPAWVSCYTMGFFLRRISHNHKFRKIMSTIIIVAALICNSIQILFSYILNISPPFFGVFCNYAHLLLGVGLFIMLKTVFSKTITENRMLFLSDQYSYQIYLTHQFFILGPLTLMKVTPYIPINIVLALVAITIASFFVKQISRMLDKFINVTFHPLRKNVEL